jgi:hypothetical protein
MSLRHWINMQAQLVSLWKDKKTGVCDRQADTEASYRSLTPYLVPRMSMMQVMKVTPLLHLYVPRVPEFPKEPHTHHEDPCLGKVN